ncbi:hypothetical protein [Flavimaricola marinus]|uniref:Virginiamycin B lyase n=1 Tax=Flavimaricola marinus TaxID=1819565 RepID=A0A238LAU3_9RHOB|nr:hypothetical protein [Flavimaricola marinus]SMY06847.1 hypothetical protein LOM8899_00977 [Flavimaricola marinus]
MKTSFMALCASVAIGFGSAALAQSANGLSGVSISPDGQSLLVTGESRVLYTLDPTTLEVRDRRWLPETASWMDHLPDGSAYLVRSDDRTIFAADAGSHEKLWEVENISGFSYAAASGKLLIYRNRSEETQFHIVDTATGAEGPMIALPELRAEAIALSDDGRFALGLTRSERTEDEPTEDAPDDLDDFAEEEFKQMHDGRMSAVIQIDVEAGTATGTPTYFTMSSADMVRMVAGVAVILDGRESALILPNGTVQMLDVGRPGGRTSHLSDDGLTMFLGDRRGLILRPLGGGEDTEIEVDAGDIPGDSEYPVAIDQGPDGTIYVGTDAYRIWAVAPDGSDLRAEPVM